MLSLLLDGTTGALPAAEAKPSETAQQAAIDKSPARGQTAARAAMSRRRGCWPRPRGADRRATLAHYLRCGTGNSGAMDRWRREKARRMKKVTEPHMQLWVPPESTRVRAILMLANNTDTVKIGEHLSIREVAAKHHMAILFMRFSKARSSSARIRRLADAAFASVLDQPATETGIDDLRHAPWITVGKSSRGRFPFGPRGGFRRVIATIGYHSETPSWPMADWSKAGDDSVLHCAVNGLTEWAGTWYRAVRPALLNYHANTNWLGHQAVILGVDHGYYPDYYIYPTFGHPMPQKMPGVPPLARCIRTWDYLAAFIDNAITVRVPAETFPDGAPITLNQD